jgi:hypothetical protein
MLLYIKYTPKAVISNNQCFIRERCRQMEGLIEMDFETEGVYRTCIKKPGLF